MTVEAVEGRPPRTLSLAGLVAELRRTVADPESSDALRAAAARRLSRLAGETDGRPALVPLADPSSWWGTRSVSRSVQPVRDPDQPVPVSASIVDAIEVCPTRWFLAREAGGVARQHQSANVGEMVHALAQRVAAGELAAGPDGVESSWGTWRGSGTGSSSGRRGPRRASSTGSGRRWPGSSPGTTPTPARCVGIEAGFRAVLDLPDGERVRLDGYADRIELDADGRVVVVDLKTGRTKPTGQVGARPTSSSASTSSPSTTAPPTSSTPDGAGRGRRARPARAARRRRARHRPAPARPGGRRRRARGAARPAGARGVASAHRELPGARRPALPRLRLRAALPDQERRVGDRPSDRPATHRSPRPPSSPRRWARPGTPATSSGLRSPRRSRPPSSSPAPVPARPR